MWTIGGQVPLTEETFYDRDTHLSNIAVRPLSKAVQNCVALQERIEPDFKPVRLGTLRPSHHPNYDFETAVVGPVGQARC